MCEERGYRLYAWSGRYAMALVAAQSGGSRGVSGHLRGDDRVGRTAPAGTSRRLGAPRARPGGPRRRRLRGVLRTCQRHQPARDARFPQPAGAVGRAGPGRRGACTPDATIEASDSRRGHATSGPRPFVAAGRAPHDGRAGDGRAGRARHRRCSTQALALPGIDDWPFDLARVRLAYGERLRRLRRTREARSQLAAARDGFERLGAASWSRRAATELGATGATRHRDAGVGAASLTPQEREIALLAATGLTNREIAARLYVSPRTVSSHLYRIFPKLGITLPGGAA